MPGHKTEYFNCVLCSKRTKPKERRRIDKSIRKYLKKKFLLEGKENSVICSKCRNIYYREKSCHKPTETQRVHLLKQVTEDSYLVHLQYPCNFFPQQRLMHIASFVKSLDQNLLLYPQSVAQPCLFNTMF